MACVQVLPEKRSLKRPRLGPPDYYPQDVRQIEDDLTPEKLRQGYCYKLPLISNEYDSGRLPKLEEKLEDYTAKVVQSYNAILSKKNEINTVHDAARKKNIPRDSFWHCAARPKMSDGWFKELAGNKPLTLLAKKFPFFNKREDIFNILVDFNVAMCRAVWFVKMTNAYLAQQQETGKIKRKQMTDPCLDWTISLTSFLRPLFNKLVEYFSSASALHSGITVDAAAALKQWQYCIKLARYMFEEGLLEKQEFLKWLLDVFSDKCQNSDEGSLKLILPVVMQYVDGILRSELLSRRLSYLCCKKLSIYYADTGSSSPDHRASPAGFAIGQWYTEFTKCSFHKSIVLSLSGIVQSILVDCPISLIWNGLKVNQSGVDSKSYLSGSPLDLLPCFPSQLPMPEGGATESIREQLKSLEQEVRQRSLAVDSRWSFDDREQSGRSICKSDELSSVRACSKTLGAIVSNILNILESLDKYCYDRSNETNNLNGLYSRIFPQDEKDFDEAMEIVVIKFLCYYAITTQRSGFYRASVVVRLLEKRKTECLVNSEIGRCTSYPFQTILFEFLDAEATPTTMNNRPRAEFSNLILLFNELIRADLFSHDVYLKCLISRGEIPANSYQIYVQRLEQQIQRSVSQSAASSAHHISNLQPNVIANAEAKHASENDFLVGVNFLDSQSCDECRLKIRLAADFNEVKDSEEVKLDMEKLLATIDHPSSSEFHGRTKEPSESSHITSPKAQQLLNDHTPSTLLGHITSLSQPHFLAGSSGTSINPVSTISRRYKSSPNFSNHFYYVLHFALPQTEDYKHESNQRQTLLFGCGSVRDSHKSMIKKFNKELNKLWHKKNSIECSSTGLMRLKRRVSSESQRILLNKFRALVNYDQQLVMDASADCFLEQIRDFVCLQTNYLPNIDNVDYFLGLYEISLNIAGLIEFIEAIFTLLPKLYNSFVSTRNFPSSPSSNYVLSLTLCCIGFLSKYLTRLVCAIDELKNIWQLLFTFIQKTNFPACCASSERYIWSFLDDIYCCSAEIRNEFAEIFIPFKSRAENAHCPEITAPATGRFDWDRKFGVEFLDDAKRDVDKTLIHLLVDKPDLRYSFVANAVCLLIANNRNNDKIFEICKVCANVTSLCPVLIEDWVSILKTITVATKILGSKVFEYGSAEFLKLVDITDNANHFPLGVLVSTLISRNCLRVETFTIHVAMHVFMPLYRRIVPETPIGVNFSSTFKVEPDIDAAVRLVLYWCAILFLRTELTSEKANDVFTAFEQESNSYLQKLLEVDSEMSTTVKQKRSIGAFISDLLLSVCQQSWLKNKLIQPCNFLDKGLFLNRMLTTSQAQKMLRMVCRLNTENGLMNDLEKCSSKKETLNKLLQNLSIWNINASFLDIELLLKQTESPAGLQELDDLIAKAAIDVFCSPEDISNVSTICKKAPNYREQFKLSDVTSVWLIAPLMSKLQPSVQGRVLKAAAMVLENGHSRKDSRIPTSVGASLLGQQPFLSLVLTCLRGQEEQREGLLGSLLRQLQEYCVQAKNDRFQCSDPQDNVEMLDSLRLRLSLVGGMFDTVCKSSSIEAWALLLVQLVLYNVIKPESDQQLFNTCCDMLCILIHSCLLPDSTVGGGERTVDDGKKSYNNISKKLRKEIGDRYIPALKAIYQLLPIPRQYHEVIACEIYGSQPLSSTKGYKAGTPTSSTMTVDSTSRKGLQATGKERISPWDLIEGYRSDSAMSKWSLFQATRVDLQPETAVGQVNKLVQHEHYHYFKRPAIPGSIGNPNDDYFLQPLNVQYDPCKIQQLRSGFAPACFVDQTQSQRRQVSTGSMSGHHHAVHGHLPMHHVTHVNAPTVGGPQQQHGHTGMSPMLVAGGRCPSSMDYGNPASVLMDPNGALSPRTKSMRGGKKGAGSTRGSRKQSRGNSNSAANATPHFNPNMNIRQPMSIPGPNMSQQNMPATPMMSMQIYHQQQQQQPTPQQQQQQHILAQQQASAAVSMQYNVASQYQTGTSMSGAGWSAGGTAGNAMMQAPSGPTPGPMSQYQQGNRSSQSTTRGAISARLRGRNQSGVIPSSSGAGSMVNSGMNPEMIGYNMTPQVPQNVQPPPTPQQQQQLSRQQAFLQQQLEQQKMYHNENQQQQQQQFADHSVQQQLQAQLEQQRQKLINENNTALMDPARVQMHRHTPGTMDHPDLIRQTTTAYASNASFGANTPNQRMAPTPMPMALNVSNRTSPAYAAQQMSGQSAVANQMIMGGGGGVNCIAQNQNFMNQQQQQQAQYNSPGDQQRMMQQQQQSEAMLVGGNRYNISNQSQNMYGNVMNQAVGRNPNQSFFAQQQQQQSPSAVVAQQYNTMSQNQHFQQQQQQQNAGMYQVQRMSFNNVPMSDPNAGGSYSNYQQYM